MSRPEPTKFLTIEQVLRLRSIFGEDRKLAIIPLCPDKKRAVAAWKRVHADDNPFSVAELRAFWKKYAGRLNPGIATGRPSGWMVVDADGQAAIDWCEEHLPPTPFVVDTPNGRHYYYQWTQDLEDAGLAGNKQDILRSKARQKYEREHGQPDAELGPVIDIRGTGGLVVGPGSKKPDGRRYKTRGVLRPELIAPGVPDFDPQWFAAWRWTRPGVGAPAVGLITDLETLARVKSELAVVTEAVDDDWPADVRLERARAWLAHADPAVEGEGGHNRTFYVVNTLVTGFGLDLDAAIELFTNEFNPRCLPPWSDEEIAHKFDDAWAQRGDVGHKLREREYRKSAGGGGRQRPDDADAAVDDDAPRIRRQPGAPPPVGSAAEAAEHALAEYLREFGIDLYAKGLIDAVRTGYRDGVIDGEAVALPYVKAVGKGRYAFPADAQNVTAVVAMAPNMPRIRRNALKDQIEVNGRTMEDGFYGSVKARLDSAWKTDVAKDKVIDAVARVADHDRYEPFAEYLRSLKWDGVSRLESVPAEVMGVVDDEQPMAGVMFRHFLTGLVARAMRPGAKVDTILFLVGEQGKRKSQFFRALVDGNPYARPEPGGPFFTDKKIDLGSKDSAMIVSTHVLIEWSEGEHAKSAAKRDQVKAHLSQTEDVYRPPYARNVVRRPRRGVFAGTSNDDELLYDPTGHRRFYIIKVRDIDLRTVFTARVQWLAEAVDIYRRHAQAEPWSDEFHATRWWFEEDEERARAEAMRRFQALGDYYEPIADWIGGRTEPFRLQDLLAGVPALSRVKRSKVLEIDIANSLKALGARNTGQKRIDGKRGTWWLPPAAAEAEDDDLPE